MMKLNLRRRENALETRLGVVERETRELRQALERAVSRGMYSALPVQPPVAQTAPLAKIVRQRPHSYEGRVLQLVAAARHRSDGAPREVLLSEIATRLHLPRARAAELATKLVADKRLRLVAGTTRYLAV